MESQNGQNQTKMSLSFSVKGTTPAKRKHEGESQRDYITSISGNHLESLNQKESEGPIVIPLPEVKQIKLATKYIHLVENKLKKDGKLSSVQLKDNNENNNKINNNETNDKNESSIETTTTVASEVIADDKTKWTYGLNIMKKEKTIETQKINKNNEEEKSKNEENEKKVKKEEEMEIEINENNIDEIAMRQLIEEAKQKEKEGSYIETSGDIELPILLKHRNTELDQIEDEKDRFLADVASRPSEASQENYENIPIEAFGKALLRGMGWYEGAPIGTTNAQVVQPIEFLHRPGYRTGLGATPVAPEPPKQKKYIKPGESRETKETMVLTDNNGNLKSIKRSDDVLVPLSKLSIHVGCMASITSGQHEGLTAKVLQLDKNNNSALIRLFPSEEDVIVDKNVLQLINNNDRQSSSSSSSKPKKEDSKKSSGSSKSSSTSTSSSKSSGGWLYNHLVVRIISKSFANGKYYLKKGTIMDVMTPTECSVKLMETNRVVDVKQNMLETVIPKAGGRVMVVSGPSKRHTGTLLSKGSDTATVKLATTLQMLSFDLDAICQYEGEDIDM